MDASAESRVQQLEESAASIRAVLGGARDTIDSFRSRAHAVQQKLGAEDEDEDVRTIDASTFAIKPKRSKAKHRRSLGGFSGTTPEALAQDLKALSVGEGRMAMHKFRGRTPEAQREMRLEATLERIAELRLDNANAARGIAMDEEDEEEEDESHNGGKGQGQGSGRGGPMSAEKGGGPAPPEFEHVRQDLMSADMARILPACIQLRKMLSSVQSPPIDATIGAGLIPRLLEFMQRDDNTELQLNAAWALTNVASGTSEQTRKVTEAGGVEMFIKLLESPNEEVAEQAVWGIGNLAGDGPQLRDYVIARNALNPLLSLLERSKKLSMIRNITWAISNFMRGKPKPSFAIVQAALPSLSRLVFSQDDDVLVDACWALSYISDGPNEHIQAVIEAGVCRRLVELLTSHNVAVLTPALRAVGNVVTGDDLQTQVVLNCGALQNIRGCLSNPKKGVRKESAWTLSNITAGGVSQIQAFIDADLLPEVLRMMQNDEFDVKKECAWVVGNLVDGGRYEQVVYAANQGAIEAIVNLMSCQEAKILEVCLSAIERILAHGEEKSDDRFKTKLEEIGGLEVIEQLQSHAAANIYDKAVGILETYFQAEEVD